MANKKIMLLVAAMMVLTAVNGQLPQQVRQVAYADSARMVAIFKDIHQNPELGFMEVRTSGIIAKELKALGFRLITGIAKTGLAGILQNGDGPVVMFRADMDCNSVKEITGLPYASTKIMKKEDGTETPVMHACGHDAHVTWMLGVAKIMVALKNQWKGTLVLLAQPAEELMTGALSMVKDSMYERGVPVPDFLLGMHTWNIPLGTIDNGTGVRFAGSDQLDVTFNGVGGHGSGPENTKDPIVMACNAVMQYQTIISRNIAAQDVAVLTVGAIHAGIDNNVIPSSAVVKLNLRWFDEKTRNILLEGIKRINEGIAIANGLSPDQYPVINMKSHVLPLDNNVDLTNKVNKAMTAVLDPKNIWADRPSAMTSEDFQYLALGNNKTVYNYIKVGVADRSLYEKAISEGKRAPFFHHSGNYKVELAAIPLGTTIGAVALLEMFRY
ncbi:MAG TPA: amidohydrolase [Chitinophagaceae bacterium]|nr:amidohydrolase [Chitinophagaceae bacterium]